MNTEAYIESGILESYILGVLPDSQKREVENNTLLFPELSSALEDLENVITQQFSASIPPPSVRQRIKEHEDERLKKWDFNEQGFHKNGTKKEEPKYLEVEVSDSTHLHVHKYWRPAFIAVFILSKIFLAAALYFYFKSDSLNKENLKLQQEIELLKK